jgi:hypothetical protein
MRFIDVNDIISVQLSLKARVVKASRMRTILGWEINLHGSINERVESWASRKSAIFISPGLVLSNNSKGELTLNPAQGVDVSIHRACSPITTRHPMSQKLLTIWTKRFKRNQRMIVMNLLRKD